MTPLKHKPNLVLVAGLPCSGKTSLAKSIAVQTGAVRLCPDERMAKMKIDLKNSEQRKQTERELIELAVSLLSAKKDVILELALWKRSEREEIRKIGINCGANVSLHFLNKPQSVLMERLKIRNKHAGGSIGYVSSKELRQWSSRIEIPTSEELSLFYNI